MSRETCGAQTRTCACGHLQKRHAPSPETRTRRGACTEEGCGCAAFAGRPCTQAPASATGNGRCKWHGGLSLSGVASGTFKGAGYSKVLPVRLAADYQTALDDPERLSLQHEIATVRALLTDSARRLATHEGAPRLLLDAAATALAARRDFRAASQAALQARGTAREALASQRQAEALTRLDGAVGSLERALDPAEAEREARQEVSRHAVVAERLLRSENTRLVELHNMLALEVVLADRAALVRVMLEAVDRHVADDATRRAIRRDTATGYAQLTGRRDAPALAP